MERVLLFGNLIVIGHELWLLGWRSLRTAVCTPLPSMDNPIILAHLLTDDL